MQSVEIQELNTVLRYFCGFGPLNYLQLSASGLDLHQIQALLTFSTAALPLV